MPDKRVDALQNFFRAARHKSKEEVLTIFLQFVIDDNDICEAGSLYMVSKDRKSLRPYKLHFHLPGATDKNSPSFSAKNKGLAWTAFMTNRTKWENGIDKGKDFVKEESDPIPVKNIVCVPIELPFGNGEQVIGVASFHNNDVEQEFDDGAIRWIEAYVSALESALAASKSPLHTSAKIFVVHGHDDDLVDDLSKVVRLHGISAQDIVILKEETCGNKTILEHLEEKVHDCVAGFVLLTPDDLGGKRVEGGEPELRPRARQNVIFEAGMLCEKWRHEGRVHFILKNEGEQPDLEQPSDLHGLKVIRYEKKTFEKQIAKVLTGWGFVAAGA